MSRKLSCEWKDSLKKADIVGGLALSCLFCSDKILKEGSVVTFGDPHIPHSFH